ncbi:hypothetical protein F4825DRAFT_456110 [Nemania diffusa]|nr:hypothetical protein F4825DRAFT_456110 [Nemania diffusa]
MAATGSTQNPDQEPRPDGEDCWRPSILSLDGGGVRGLSSLYILREIMAEIKRLDDEQPNNHLEGGRN